MALAPSRNAPCPCGSGLRYKECHGALVLATADPLADARADLARGDVVRARMAAQRILDASGDDPQALELLARCAAAAGEVRERLRLCLRTVRAMSRHSVPPAFAFNAWSELGLAFTEALRERGGDAVPVRRREYVRWCEYRTGPGRAQPTAVVIAIPPGVPFDATIDSIARQTLAPDEVVVVPMQGAGIDASLRIGCDRIGANVRWVDSRPSSLAEAVHAGVAACSSPWIVAVEAPHAFAPSHLASLCEAVARSGAQWAFSDATIESRAGTPAERVAGARQMLDSAQSTLARAESVGWAFVGITFPAMGAGAMLFTRELYDAVGGYRPLARDVESWDFALRAVCYDEPVHVRAATYRHVVLPDQVEAPPAERDAAQLALFRAFYARAADEGFQPRNAFAPTLGVWGTAFLRRLFAAGHILMVGPDTLERFASMLDAHFAPAGRALEDGVNLIGFPFAEFGLGENLRGVARSCREAGIPFVVNELEHALTTRQTDRTLEGDLAHDVRHRFSLVCANPDVIAGARPWLERTRRAGGRTAGYWFWELETLPPAWLSAIQFFDELWCATEFIAAAMRKATSKPVVKLPPAVEVALAREHRRGEHGLPDGRFLFVFTFDYNSFVARKNPDAVIAAFRAAFPRGRDDVGLVVKSVNGMRRPERAAAIEAQIGGDSRIHHLDGFLDRESSYGLLSLCDCYVSLHRAEGLGLGLAEAMLLGKPAIATGYSGNLEFMNEANSLLVDYSMVPVRPGDYLYDDPSFFWAEPDVEDAARKMRAIVDDASLRVRLAVEAPLAVRRVFDPRRSAERLRARLVELGIVKP